ncbi:hypothetical protein ACX80H_11025 [Arthrobacter sp. MDT2-2]
MVFASLFALFSPPAVHEPTQSAPEDGPAVNIPEVNIPEVNVPEVNVPEVNVSVVNIPVRGGRRGPPPRNPIKGSVENLGTRSAVSSGAAGNLGSRSVRQLRVLADHLYRELDTDFPPFGAQDAYTMVVDELGLREASQDQGEG